MRENHGLSKTKIYKRWSKMHHRCKHRKLYIERGVCPEWSSFTKFFNDMNSSFEKHAHVHGVDNTLLDRVDNSKGYSKKNCRWATKLIQNQNRDDVINVTIGGETKPICNWAVDFGLHVDCVYSRLRRGATPKSALGIE